LRSLAVPPNRPLSLLPDAAQGVCVGRPDRWPYITTAAAVQKKRHAQYDSASAFFSPMPLSWL
jgi:hypothetical protein